jgi:hypothetical protein
LSETMQSVGSHPYGISCIWGTEYLGSFHTDLIFAQLQHPSKYAFFAIFVTGRHSIGSMNVAFRSGKDCNEDFSTYAMYLKPGHRE